MTRITTMIALLIAFAAVLAIFSHYLLGPGASTSVFAQGHEAEQEQHEQPANGGGAE